MAILAVLVPSLWSCIRLMEDYLPLLVYLLVRRIPAFLCGRLDAHIKINCRGSKFKTMALSGAFVFILSSLKIPSVTGSVRIRLGWSGDSYIWSVRYQRFRTICLLFGPSSWLTAAWLLWVPMHSQWQWLVHLSVILSYKFAKSIQTIHRYLSLSVRWCGLGETYATTSIQLSLVFPDANNGFVGSAWNSWVSSWPQIPIAIVEGLLTVVLYVAVSNIKERAGLFQMKNIRISS